MIAVAAMKVKTTAVVPPLVPLLVKLDNVGFIVSTQHLKRLSSDACRKYSLILSKKQLIRDKPLQHLTLVASRTMHYSFGAAGSIVSLTLFIR